MAIPPVATSGSSVASAHELEQREQAHVGRRARLVRAAVPAGLEALDHERVGAGVRRGGRLGLALVTVTHDAQPAARSESSTPGSGHPKVNDTTGTASSRISASLAFQPSSS